MQRSSASQVRDAATAFARTAEPTHRCSALLDAWCDACCERPEHDSLHARKLTRTEIISRGERLFFWNCHPRSSLNATIEAVASGQDVAVAACGILSEREPQRYKSFEQRLLEQSLRKCVASRVAGDNSTYGSVFGESRHRAVTTFGSQCRAYAAGQAERKALRVAQGLFNHRYPPAQGCDDRLNRWCERSCPPRAAGEVLVARKIIRSGRRDNVTVWSWGCFPRSMLLATAAPRYARLRNPKARQAAGGFCGNFSAWRVPTMVWRGATRSQDHIRRRPMEEAVLGSTARACAASIAARTLRATLLRKPLVVPTDLRATEGYTLGRPTSPNCSASAYVSVLTVSQWGNTFMSRSGAAGLGAVSTSTSAATRFQWALLLTLVRSIRRHELCVRDFVLLLGVDVGVPAPIRDALGALSVTIVRIEPLDPSIPPLDHLHAWRLMQYRRVVVLDSDMLAVRSLDGLLEETRRFPAGQLIMGHHAYDKAQRACGLQVGQRANGGLLVLRPYLRQFEEALLYVQRGLACGRPPSTFHGRAGKHSVQGANDVVNGSGIGGGHNGTEDPTSTGGTSSTSSTPSNGDGDGDSISSLIQRVQRAMQDAEAAEAALKDPRKFCSDTGCFELPNVAQRMGMSDLPDDATNSSSSSDGVSTTAAPSATANRSTAALNLSVGHASTEFRQSILERPCFREEQTGLACYFSGIRRLRVLPCAYSYDVGNPLHQIGEQHHQGCLKKSRIGEATCNAIAGHVAQQCTWDRVVNDVHVIHFKGKVSSIAPPHALTARTCTCARIPEPFACTRTPMQRNQGPAVKLLNETRFPAPPARPTSSSE
jgi:hypothetical protein